MSQNGRNGTGDSPLQRGLDRFKEFAPTSFSIEHSTSTAVLLVIITLMGIISYNATPKESFPEAEIPMIAISTGIHLRAAAILSS